MMKIFIHRYWFQISIIGIILFSLTIRFVKLDQIPAGLTWDEAAIGYNGYAIWETRRDEWLNRLPVSFKSFGDYKAPLAIYINGFFTYFLSFDFLKKSDIPFLQFLHVTMSKVFNLNVWTVRLPFVLSGVAGVVGMIYLTRTVFEKFFFLQKPLVEKIGIVTGLLLSASPWFFHFTRAGFESGMSLTFLIGMEIFLFQFISSIQQTKVIIVWKNFVLISLSVFMMSASMYTYHSAKIVAPLLFLFTLLTFYSPKNIFKKLSLAPLFVGFIISVVLLFPMMKDTVGGSGGERFSQTTIFSQTKNSSFISLLPIFAGNFVHHFSPHFLFQGETTTLRHGAGEWGVIYILDGVFIMLTLILYLRKKGNVLKTNKQRQFLIFSLFWILVGVVPAGLGTEIPHANRALLAIPGFILLSGIGFFETVSLFSKRQVSNKLSLQNIVAILLIFSYIFLSCGYFRHYFTVFAKESEKDFYYGYAHAMEFAKEYEPVSDKILFTSEYGQPYIYALFIRKTNPIWYQGGSLVKFEFTDKINEGDLHRKNTAIIATPNEIDPQFGDELIIASDGKVKFVLINPKNIE